MQAIDLAYRAMKPIAVAALIVGLGMPFQPTLKQQRPNAMRLSIFSDLPIR